MRSFIRQVLLLLLLPCVVRAGTPKEWALPDYPHRVLLDDMPDTEGHVLLKIPSSDGHRTPVSAAALDADGILRAHQVVHADEDFTWVLIDAEHHQRGRPTAVYYRPGQDDQLLSSLPPDPAPLSVSVYRAIGRSDANTWEKLLHLVKRAGTPVATCAAAATDKLDLAATIQRALEQRNRERTHRGAKRPKKQKPVSRSIVHYQGHVLCPQRGRYRFALAGTRYAFLAVDGKPHVAMAHRYNQGKDWFVGEAHVLEPGPHLLDVFVCAGTDAHVRVGWAKPPPGDETYEQEAITIDPLPAEALCTVREPDRLVFEDRETGERPAFSVVNEPSYTFRGHDTVFTPVTFPIRSLPLSLRRESRPVLHWDFGDGSPVREDPDRYSKGEVQQHVYTRPGRYVTTLRFLTEDGRIAEARRPVHCLLSPPREFAANFDLVDLPPVCYAADKVEPRLRVWGLAPRDVTFQLQVRTRTRDGREQQSEHDLAILSPARYLPLFSRPAADLAEFDWSVRVHGKQLAGGLVQLASPPFHPCPARVEGNRLVTDNGSTVVLVPDRFAGEVAPAPSLASPGRVLWVDDFLLDVLYPEQDPAEGFRRAVDDALGAQGDMEVLHLAGEANVTGLGHFATLGKLAASTGERERGNLVLLSLGRQDMLAHRSPEMFERNVAALTDLVSTALGSAILWVTPPPYPDDPDRSRPYAAAILRVADARGVPVADLYTAFHGMAADPSPFFEKHDTSLSRKGRSLAARVIGRAFAQEKDGS